MIDDTLEADDLPYLLLPDDERPIVCLAPGKSEHEYEVDYGWAISEVINQRHGWLTLLRYLISSTEMASEAA